MGFSLLVPPVYIQEHYVLVFDTMRTILKSLFANIVLHLLVNLINFVYFIARGLTCCKTDLISVLYFRQSD